MKNIIRFMINTPSDLSPQKRLLNYEEFSPTKITVGCEINGWFQTHKKSPIPQKRKLPKYIHSRFNVNKRLKENVMPLDNMIIQNPYKANLLSITKLKSPVDALSTKCKTFETKSSTKRNNQNEIIEIQVSPFEQDNENKVKDKKKENLLPHFFHMHEIKHIKSQNSHSGSITGRMQEHRRRIQRFSSYNKIRNMGKQCLQSHVDSHKIFLINQSQQIVKGNLSTNQKRSLNMIVKQGKFNLINMEGEANKRIGYLNENQYENKVISKKLSDRKKLLIK